MKALDTLQRISRQLSARGIPEPGKEAEIILCHVLGLDRTSLYRDNPRLEPSVESTLQEMVEKRTERVPLQYILGEVEFYGLTIKVGPGVLIPRPETETVIDEILSLRKDGFLKENPSVLDIGTGSGCIGLTLAKEIPGSRIIGVEPSEQALYYCRQNIEINNIENFIPLKGKLFEPVDGMTFDLIVSNPPYIRSNDIPGLQQEVSLYEPRQALDGGIDGLEFFRKILRKASFYLNPVGLVVLEIGIDQAADVINIAATHGLDLIRSRKDLAGIPRVLTFVRKKP